MPTAPCIQGLAGGAAAQGLSQVPAHLGSSGGAVGTSTLAQLVGMPPATIPQVTKRPRVTATSARSLLSTVKNRVYNRNLNPGSSASGQQVLPKCGARLTCRGWQPPWQKGQLWGKEGSRIDGTAFPPECQPPLVQSVLAQHLLMCRRVRAESAAPPGDKMDKRSKQRRTPTQDRFP